MKRPKELPDFGDPPLDEVVLGVQFEPIPAYKSIDANAVWELFRSEFPNVEEQPPIAPVFETFGGMTPQAGFQFHFGPIPPATRLWFVSPDGSHLLQFQPDRFLLNWRKHQGITPYPRFEQVSASFLENLVRLSNHIEKEKSFKIEVNQVEISYINIITVKEFSEIGDWIAIWKALNLNIEGVNMAFPEVILDPEGRPSARLHHEITSAVTPDGSSKALRLVLTYRGKPPGRGIEEATRFMAEGRIHIVNRFAELTTEHAHRIWKRLG